MTAKVERFASRGFSLHGRIAMLCKQPQVHTVYRIERKNTRQ